MRRVLQQVHEVKCDGSCTISWQDFTIGPCVMLVVWGTTNGPLHSRPSCSNLFGVLSDQITSSAAAAGAAVAPGLQCSGRH